MSQIFILIFLVILLCPTTAKIYLAVDKNAVFLQIKLYLLGIFPLKRETSFCLNQTAQIPISGAVKSLKSHPQSQIFFKEIFLHSFTIHHLSADLHLFLADKYHLGIINAVYWILSGSLSSFLSSKIQLNFTPLFQKNHSRLYFSCILSCSPAQIIFNTIMYLSRFIYPKYKRRNTHGYSSY